MPRHWNRSLASALWLSISLTLFALSACTSGTATSSTPEAGKSQVTQPTPLPPPLPGQGLSRLAGLIMKHPAQYANQQVTLVGYFRGQDLLDEVILDAPTDRLRDWVLKDDSGAIYVSFRGLLPFSPNSQEIWRILRVRGTVEIHRSGMPYIVPQEVTWEGLIKDYDFLPAFCLLAVHRFGGKDQLDHHIYWYTSRNLVVYDAKQKWRGSVQLKSSLVSEWEKEFAATGFFNLPSATTPPCSDCIRYEIAAVDQKEDKPYFVTLYEGFLPPKLEAFVQQLVEETGQAATVH
jgi:hypothetical protein